MTVMVIVAVPDPPLLVAVTVWTVCACRAVGVPEITQVDELSERPAGRAAIVVDGGVGARAQDTTAPPDRVGVILAATVLVRV